MPLLIPNDIRAKAPKTTPEVLVLDHSPSVEGAWAADLARAALADASFGFFGSLERELGHQRSRSHHLPPDRSHHGLRRTSGRCLATNRILTTSC